MQAVRETVAREAEEAGHGAILECCGCELRLRLAGSLPRMRSDRCLTQRRLSGLSGVPQDTISELENGQANPSLSTLTALAAALGCTLDLGLTPRDAEAEEN